MKRNELKKKETKMKKNGDNDIHFFSINLGALHFSAHNLYALELRCDCSQHIENVIPFDFICLINLLEDTREKSLS